MIPIKEQTLLFLTDGKEVCLGLKARGFGEGLWNGFGGTIEKGETPEEAAIRECDEECHIRPSEASLKKVGILTFKWLGKYGHKLEAHMNVHTYICRQWLGCPRPSEEMKEVKFFRYAEIPYESMWPDDQQYLPHALAGLKFDATFVYTVRTLTNFWFDFGDEKKWLLDK